MSADASLGAKGSQVARRRRQVAVYLAITFALSWLWGGLLIRAGGLMSWGMLGPAVIMWIPGVVGLALRLAGREGFRDVGWRLGAARFWLASLLLPIGVGLCVYLPCWLARWASFRPPWERIEARLGPGATGYALFVLLAVTLGMLPSFATALGEELGWRGYLLTRLVEARLPRPLVLGGLIWALWHVPLILWGGYSTSPRPWLSAVLFTVGITAAGVFIGWARLASGSVWVAAFAHAAWNAIIQGVFMRSTDPAPYGTYLAGESGVLTALGLCAVAVWLHRTGRLEQARRLPVEPQPAGATP